MIWFRRRGLLLGEELTAAQFECFAWLLRHTGGYEEFRKRVLVVPTSKFFRRSGQTGHAFAEAMFEQTRHHAMMADWPCAIEPQEHDPETKVSRYAFVQGAPQGPAGTFRRTDDGVLITYHPRNVGDAMSLIATFAHELAHYRTANFPEPPPGGWEVWEPATDLAAAFLGFGIFLANTRFQFSQFTSANSSGWRWQRQGYVSEAEILQMHAIFCVLQELPPKETLAHLKPALRGMFKRVYKEVLADTVRIATLRMAGPFYGPTQGP